MRLFCIANYFLFLTVSPMEKFEIKNLVVSQSLRWCLVGFYIFFSFHINKHIHIFKTSEQWSPQLNICIFIDGMFFSWNKTSLFILPSDWFLVIHTIPLYYLKEFSVLNFICILLIRPEDAKLQLLLLKKKWEKEQPWLGNLSVHEYS